MSHLIVQASKQAGRQAGRQKTLNPHQDMAGIQFGRNMFLHRQLTLEAPLQNRPGQMEQLACLILLAV